MTAGLKKKVGGVFVDIGAEAPNPLFRGEWEADSLAKQFNFATGIHPEFVPFNTQYAKPPEYTNVPALNYGGTPSAFVGAVKLETINMNDDDYAQLSLDLSQLGIENISRVSAWFASANISNRDEYYRQEIRVNGIVAAATPYASHPWMEISASATEADVVAFRLQGNYSANLNAWGVPAAVTGIQIFNRTKPYMMGEFVTHEGQMWKSLIDDNGSMPGTNVNWELALTLPPSRGTTAERPDPVTAGAGFYYYDQTLGQPIWSNGTAWTDAMKNLV